MVVLICGGRSFRDWPLFLEMMRQVELRVAPVTAVVHGGASGADTMAGEWARSRGLYVREFPAQWDQFGPAAGPVRNQQMLDEARPGLVVAMPGGAGTQDMVERAAASGVRVLRHLSDLLDQEPRLI